MKKRLLDTGPLFICQSSSAKAAAKGVGSQQGRAPRGRAGYVP